MAILNYTSRVSVDQSIAEISKILRKHGAKSISTDYDDDNEPVGLGFVIDTPFGRRWFALPANTLAVWRVMGVQQAKGVIPKSCSTSQEQAERVAWRILKDWIEAQMALIETEMVTLTQVMLPYMKMDNGDSVYEFMEQRQLALPSGQ